jgi:hypothetical protein
LSYFALCAGVLAPAAVSFLLLRLLYNIGLPLNNVPTASLRQAVVEKSIQGRTNASIRCVTFGALGVGSLLGGVVAGFIGLVATIEVGGGTLNLLAACIASSPVLSRIRELPFTPTVGPTVAMATEVGR